MIVYNVQREWFSLKSDAETLRRSNKLPPFATFTLRIETREELAALLNGLCGIGGAHRYVEAAGEPIPEKVLARNEVYAPDFVPKFLAESWAKRMRGIHND